MPRRSERLHQLRLKAQKELEAQEEIKEIDQESDEEENNATDKASNEKKGKHLDPRNFQIDLLKESMARRMALIPSGTYVSRGVAFELHEALDACGMFYVDINGCGMYFALMKSAELLKKARASFKFRAHFPRDFQKDEVLTVIAVPAVRKFIRAMRGRKFEEYYPALMKCRKAAVKHIPLQDTDVSVREKTMAFINDSNWKTLETNGRIPRAIAKEIVRERRNNGPFVSFASIAARVAGVNKKLQATLEKDKKVYLNCGRTCEYLQSQGSGLWIESITGTMVCLPEKEHYDDPRDCDDPNQLNLEDEFQYSNSDDETGSTWERDGCELVGGEGNFGVRGDLSVDIKDRDDESDTDGDESDYDGIGEAEELPSFPIRRRMSDDDMNDDGEEQLDNTVAYDECVEDNRVIYTDPGKGAPHLVKVCSIFKAFKDDHDNALRRYIGKPRLYSMRESSGAILKRSVGQSKAMFFGCAHSFLKPGSELVAAYVWHQYNADVMNIPAGQKVRSFKNYYKNGHNKVAKLYGVTVSGQYFKYIDQYDNGGTKKSAKAVAAYDFSFAVLRESSEFTRRALNAAPRTTLHLVKAEDERKCEYRAEGYARRVPKGCDSALQKRGNTKFYQQFAQYSSGNLLQVRRLWQKKQRTKKDVSYRVGEFTTFVQHGMSGGPVLTTVRDRNGKVREHRIVGTISCRGIYEGSWKKPEDSQEQAFAGVCMVSDGLLAEARIFIAKVKEKAGVSNEARERIVQKRRRSDSATQSEDTPHGDRKRQRRAVKATKIRRGKGGISKDNVAVEATKI